MRTANEALYQKSQQTTKQISVLLFVSVAPVFESVAAAESKNKAAQAVNHPCAEKRFHEILAEKFKNQLTSAEQAVKAARETQTGWLILKEKLEGTGRTAGISCLIPYAQHLISNAEAEIRSNQPTLRRAAELLMQRAANITTTLTFQAAIDLDLGTPAVGGAPTKPSEATVNCKYSNTKLTIKPVKCNGDSDQHKQITDEAMSLINIDELPTITGKYETELTLTAQAYSRGNPTSADTDNQYGMCQATVSASATLGAATGLGLNLERTVPTAAATRTTTTADSSGKCPHDDDSQDRSDTQILVNAVCKARQTMIKHAPDLQAVALPLLSADPTFRSIAALTLLDNGASGADISEANKALTAAINAALGPDQEAFKRNYITALSESKLELNLKNGKIEGTLAQIAKGPQAARAIAYYTGLSIQNRNKKRTQTPIQDKKLSDKCKEGTEESKCTEDTDCEHKDGKCQVKEGVKVEGNGGKNTNTTGSNSFVINKAPLWLAFLILA
uniref:Variant surface glycoprotein 1125.238 n=1 Tax=Trypanosoma brucei TaxID=5691 RepID=A0A1J0R5H0_9TRYP|nr:variant surface glycoprotein 1125.238 [Trypanosoma brucei]